MKIIILIKIFHIFSDSKVLYMYYIGSVTELHMNLQPFTAIRGFQQFYLKIFHVKIHVLQVILLFIAPRGLCCTYVGFTQSE